MSASGAYCYHRPCWWWWRYWRYSSSSIGLARWCAELRNSSEGGRGGEGWVLPKRLCVGGEEGKGKMYVRVKRPTFCFGICAFGSALFVRALSLSLSVCLSLSVSLCLSLSLSLYKCVTLTLVSVAQANVQLSLRLSCYLQMHAKHSNCRLSLRVCVYVCSFVCRPRGNAPFHRTWCTHTHTYTYIHTHTWNICRLGYCARGNLVDEAYIHSRVRIRECVDERVFDHLREYVEYVKATIRFLCNALPTLSLTRTQFTSTQGKRIYRSMEKLGRALLSLFVTECVCVCVGVELLSEGVSRRARVLCERYSTDDGVVYADAGARETKWKPN